MLRRRYEVDMVQRFRRVRTAIRQALVVNDVLGIRPRSITQRVNSLVLSTMVMPVFGTPQRRAFQMIRPAERVEAFVNWAFQLSQEIILETNPNVPSRSARLQNWQTKYLQMAYDKGQRDAVKKMRARHVALDAYDAKKKEKLPPDSRVAILQQRSYSELEGINDEMSRKLSRRLSQGVAQGKSPKEIADEIVDDIDISITRARTLARTETISAHAEASLDAYEEAGIDGVEVEAEFMTAGDDEVCEECEDLEGEIMEIEDARGLIPVHPNCRCAFLPVVSQIEED